jgi:filamentous hemagglutinin family protein
VTNLIRISQTLGVTIVVKTMLLASAVVALNIVCPFARADATTDGSVGLVEHRSGDFTIPQSLGRVRGNNLFHSFRQFNIHAGEKATFTTDTASLKNVISRVTGGEPSAIYGTLKLEAAAGSKPDFYFINPAGVVFGAGASVDVPGGFHVSTAQRLKFSDGFAWDTVTPTASSLTVASPETFGFLGGSPQGAIVMHNRDALTLSSTKHLDIAMKAGTTLTIAAGDIEIESASISGQEGNYRFAAIGSRAVDVNLATTASLVLSNPNQPGNPISLGGENVTKGKMVFHNDAFVETKSLAVSNGPVGTITIVADDLSIVNRSEIRAITFGSGAGGVIDITAGSMVIDAQFNSLISGVTADARASSTGTQDPGQIKIVADHLSLINGKAQISSSTASISASAAKSAGPVEIRVNSLLIDGRGMRAGSIGIFSNSATGSRGKGGAVTVIAKDGVSIRDKGQISSNADGIGAAGAVVVGAKTIDIDGVGAESTGISSAAGETGPGQPGNVTVTASEWIRLRNAGKISIRSTSKTGSSENTPTFLGVTAPNIELDQALITATVTGSSKGGNIVINAGNRLRLTDSTITTESVNGDGGPIVVNAGTVIHLRNSQITSSVGGALNGNGGNIEIGGNALVLESGFIQANTKAPRASGGVIGINTKRLILNGSYAFVGGNKIEEQVKDVAGFNVIQAAAPDGVGGNLLISNPELDISGALLGLTLPPELGALSQDLCEVGANSSFTRLGRGAVFPSSKDPMSP